MALSDTQHGQVALGFAAALAAGNFRAASDMLTPAVRRQWGAEQLAAEYYAMVELYHDGFQPANDIEVMSVLDSWPGKQPSDIGWAYVAISGDFARGAWCEGVAVVVTRHRDRPLIREVEWGRP